MFPVWFNWEGWHFITVLFSYIWKKLINDHILCTPLKCYIRLCTKQAFHVPPSELMQFSATDDAFEHGLSTRNFSWSFKKKKKKVQSGSQAPQKPSRYIVSGLCKWAACNNATSPAMNCELFPAFSPGLPCVRVELFIWPWLNKQKILKWNDWGPKLKGRSIFELNGRRCFKLLLWLNWLPHMLISLNLNLMMKAIIPLVLIFVKRRKMER